MEGIIGRKIIVSSFMKGEYLKEDINIYRRIRKMQPTVFFIKVLLINRWI